MRGMSVVGATQPVDSLISVHFDDYFVTLVCRSESHRPWLGELLRNEEGFNRRDLHDLSFLGSFSTSTPLAGGVGTGSGSGGAACPPYSCRVPISSSK